MSDNSFEPQQNLNAVSESALVSSPAPQATETQPQGRFVTQDELNKMIGGAKEYGRKKGMEEALKQYQPAQNAYEAPINQSNYVQPNQGQYAQAPDVNAIAETVEQRMFQKLLAAQQEQQAQALRQAVSASENAARQKYADYDDVVKGNINPALVPGLDAMVASLPNGGEVKYYLAKNNADLANMLVTTPEQQFARLKSIAMQLENQAATQEQVKHVRVNEPIAQPKPSVAGLNPSKKPGLNDLKRMYRI